MREAFKSQALIGTSAIFIILCMPVCWCQLNHRHLALQLNGMRRLIAQTVASRGTPNLVTESFAGLECFDYYMPVLNNITEQFELNYRACLDEADRARTELNDRYNGKRCQLSNQATGVCARFQDCDNLEEPLHFFQCYADTASDNIKLMFYIATNASDMARHLQEDFRLIDNEQYRCTNASERAYVEDTAKTYAQLQDCLEGKSEVPKTVTHSDGTKEVSLSLTDDNRRHDGPQHKLNRRSDARRKRELSNQSNRRNCSAFC